MNFREQLAAIRNGDAPKTTGAKPKKPIAKVSVKKRAEIEADKAARNGQATEQELWYANKMATSEPVCAECGMRADWVKEPGNEKIWHACQAHLLPKKKSYGFPSLATHPNNHIILFPSWGGHLCGCHGFYDSNWYNASTMKIWAEVKQIIETTLLPIVPQKERKNIPNIFAQ